MGKRTNISVFNYTDYRTYLRDYFNDRKKSNRKYSYRVFAKDAGYNSSGLLIDVIKSRSNIQSGVILKFARGLGLKKRESAYFENLVHFNQSESILEKNHYFENMMRLLAKDAHKVQAGQYVFYSEWYFTAIRDLLSIFNFKNDYKALARELNPPISVIQAKSAIRKLIKYKFIKKDESGFYRATEQSITTGPEVKSLHIKNFQRAMLDLAKDALNRFPSEQRDISTLTFSANAESMKAIKAEIEAANTRIMNIIQQSKNEDRICQLNMQLFPLSRIKEERE